MASSRLVVSLVVSCVAGSLLGIAACRRQGPASTAPATTAATVAPPSKGGLRLTGRALVAVPRDDHKVFLSWRFLPGDEENTPFVVWRSGADAQPERVGEVTTSTTFSDDPGRGRFAYWVVPASGSLSGQTSNVANVLTSAKGRDWVEVLPAARGRKLQVSDRHFADTDGDGELEFVTYSPQVPSYRGAAMPTTFKLQVLDLFEGLAPRWEYDTGMGMQTEPFAAGDKRMDWDYEWTFKPVAWDIDGDHKAEIITLVKRQGRYQYAVLADRGDHAEELGFLESPIPVGQDRNNNRHFPFFADLGGTHYSFLLQTGTYQEFEIWAYDWNGHGFDLLWHVDSKVPGFSGNRSCSHTVLVMDIDGDGRDEISNGATMLDDDGSVLWQTNEYFGQNTHIDGQVIDDIDPRRPGLEIMLHEEQGWNPDNAMGDRWGLFDLRTGQALWTKKAPGTHLQLNVAFSMRERGLDIVGTYGGHRPQGGFAALWDGTDIPYPLDAFPHSGDRMWSMDWLGNGSKQLQFNFTKIVGPGAKVLYEVDLSDAPEGEVVPWTPDHLNHFWFNVDLVGDHREDIPVQMRDGSIRVYLNTAPLGARSPTKWASHSYQMMQAPGDYRYFIAAH